MFCIIIEFLLCIALCKAISCDKQLLSTIENRLNDDVIFGSRINITDVDSQYKKKYLQYICKFNKVDTLYHDLGVNPDIVIQSYSNFVDSDIFISQFKELKLEHTYFSDLSKQQRHEYGMTTQDYQQYLQNDFIPDSCVYQAPPSSPVQLFTNNSDKCQPVQNQDDCGSCWAFSTTAQFEFNYFVEMNVFEKFSEQYVLDCSDAGMYSIYVHYICEHSNLQT